MRVDTVLYFSDTSTRTGSTRLARCSFLTFSVCVALNRKVFLPSLGREERIVSMAASKSKESMRSASSMTRYWMLLRLKPA